jgi:hypothetical protein
MTDPNAVPLGFGPAAVLAWYSLGTEGFPFALTAGDSTAVSAKGKPSRCYGFAQRSGNSMPGVSQRRQKA